MKGWAALITAVSAIYLATAPVAHATPMNYEFTPAAGVYVDSSL